MKIIEDSQMRGARRSMVKDKSLVDLRDLGVLSVVKLIWGRVFERLSGNCETAQQ